MAAMQQRFSGVLGEAFQAAEPFIREPLKRVGDDLSKVSTAVRAGDWAGALKAGEAVGAGALGLGMVAPWVNKVLATMAPTMGLMAATGAVGPEKGLSFAAAALTAAAGDLSNAAGTLGSGGGPSTGARAANIAKAQNLATLMTAMCSNVDVKELTPQQVQLNEALKKAEEQKTALAEVDKRLAAAKKEEFDIESDRMRGSSAMQSRLKRAKDEIAKLNAERDKLSTAIAEAQREVAKALAVVSDAAVTQADAAKAKKAVDEGPAISKDMQPSAAAEAVRKENERRAKDKAARAVDKTRADYSDRVSKTFKSAADDLKDTT